MKISLSPNLHLVALLAVSLEPNASGEEIITPVSATSTTQWDEPRPMEDAINGTLLSSDGTSGDILSETVAFAGSDGHWLSANDAVDSGTTSTTEVLTFDLGGTFDVNAVHLWPYIRTQFNRGLSSFDLSFSSDGINFSDPLTLSGWTVGPGGTTEGEPVETQTFTAVPGVTHLRMTNLTTHGSTGFVAISEIRFGGTVSGQGPVTLGSFHYDPSTGDSEVSLTGAPGTAYTLVESGDLNFTTPNPVTLLAAIVGSLNGNEVTTDRNGQAMVRFNLGTAKAVSFIRAQTP